MQQTENNATRGSRSYLVPLRSIGWKSPLFCIHVPSSEFAAGIKEGHPVYCLRAPELDEALHLLTVEQLAKIYLHEIRAVQPRSPYLLCGYSFGGLLAYEIATMLISEGEEVALLALFDAIHPQFKSNLSTAELLRFRSRYLIDRCVKYVRNLVRANIYNILADLRLFTVSRFQRFAWEITRVASRAAGRPMPQILLSSSQIFKAAIRSYCPGPYPSRLTLFRAQDRRAEYDNDPTLGWGVCVTGGIDVHSMAVAHEDMLHGARLATLTEWLNESIESASVDAKVN
jgi:thioesterase domain-containing protein